MLSTLLVAVNAKYTHTNLAVRYLAACARRAGVKGCGFAEYHINLQPDEVTAAIARLAGERVAFSCYIWNRSFIDLVARRLRLVRPELRLYCGGPEAEWDPQFLERHPWCDGVLCGEGEGAVPLLAAGRPEGEVPGLLYRAGGSFRRNPPAPPLPLEELPFVYGEGELPPHRHIYYESSRGCPFSCHYCLSGAGGRVRFKPLEQTLQELDFFLEQRVVRVKFVDRTFNCDRQRARAIWRHLMERDNGVTNFHFELGADLLGPEEVELLRAARPGLFQFEIGVQSTNPQTVASVQRVHDFAAISRAVRGLLAGENIHLHLDLIAGLPFEDKKTFGRSFDQVYALGPHQLQLGFLKLLHGSRLRAEAGDYGIVFCPDLPPYEVLKTRWLSYEDICALKRAEGALETFSNSGRYRASIAYLAACQGSPFALFCQMGDALAEEPALSREGKHAFLWRFGRGRPGVDEQRLREALRLDWLCCEKPRKRLPFLDDSSLTPRYRRAAGDFFGDGEKVARYLPSYLGEHPGHIARTAHLEVFARHPLTGAPGPVAIAFDYRRRDIWGGARWQVVPLEGTVGTTA